MDLRLVFFFGAHETNQTKITEDWITYGWTVMILPHQSQQNGRTRRVIDGWTIIILCHESNTREEPKG